MSAILMSTPGRCDLEDDLEAFFHVLLYMGVRYLKHNFVDVGGFMSKFFDDANYHDGRMSCGTLKMGTMRSAEIVWTEDQVAKKLEFEGWSDSHTDDPALDAAFERHDEPEAALGAPCGKAQASTAVTEAKGLAQHPLTALFAKLLSWFKDYYAKNLDISLKRTVVKTADLKPSVLTTADAQLLANLQPEREAEAKTSEDYPLADNLENHSAVLLALKEWLDKKVWPSDDKAAKDQLPSDYDPWKEMFYRNSVRPSIPVSEHPTRPAAGTLAPVEEASEMLAEPHIFDNEPPLPALQISSTKKRGGATEEEDTTEDSEDKAGVTEQKTQSRNVNIKQQRSIAVIPDVPAAARSSQPKRPRGRPGKSTNQSRGGNPTTQSRTGKLTTGLRTIKKQQSIAAVSDASSSAAVPSQSQRILRSHVRVANSVPGDSTTQPRAGNFTTLSRTTQEQSSIATVPGASSSATGFTQPQKVVRPRKVQGPPSTTIEGGASSSKPKGKGKARETRKD